MATTVRPDAPGPMAGGGAAAPGARTSSCGSLALKGLRPTQLPPNRPTPGSRESSRATVVNQVEVLTQAARRPALRVTESPCARVVSRGLLARGDLDRRRHAGLHGRDGPKNVQSASRWICSMRLLANTMQQRGQRLTNTLHGFTRRTAGGVTEGPQHPRALVGAFPGEAGLKGGSGTP